MATSNNTESIVIDIIDKETKALNLTFSIIEEQKGRTKVNLRYEDKVLDGKKFMECYKHIRSKVESVKTYAGWDLTCQKLNDGRIRVLNEGSLFFDDNTLIIDLVSKEP